MAPLINATQLDAWRHSDSPPRILDASWHLPATGRHARREFAVSHLPHAQFLDLDLFCNPDAPVPNMLSTDIHAVKKHFEALGIHAGQSIVLYDQSEIHSSCRAYWLFRLWGFPASLLHILDGGFHLWNKQGFIVSSGVSDTTPSTTLGLTLQPDCLTTLQQVKEHLRHPQAQLVDLRHPVRFAGGPEPRGRRGHIPGSFCFPWFAFFSGEGCFLPFEKLSRRLQDVGIDPHDRIITSCGSGMTAPILNFVLDNLSQFHHSLYDGSWAEWGAETCFPGESSLLERPVMSSLATEAASLAF